MAHSHTPPESSKILEIYLLIAQYPMLASDIRRRMREELFRRGIITPQRFDAEVKEKAIQSQQREGIYNGLQAENAEQWDLRWSRVRRTLTSENSAATKKPLARTRKTTATRRIASMSKRLSICARI